MGSMCNTQDPSAPESYEKRQKELSNSRVMKDGNVGSSSIGLISSKVNLAKTH